MQILKKVYGKPVDTVGPEHKDTTISLHNGTQKLLVTFNDNTAKGLALTDSKDCNLCCSGDTGIEVLDGGPLLEIGRKVMFIPTIKTYYM